MLLLALVVRLSQWSSLLSEINIFFDGKKKKRFSASDKQVKEVKGCVCVRAGVYQRERERYLFSTRQNVKVSVSQPFLIRILQHPSMVITQFGG